MIIRFKFSKTDESKYLSHLDVLRLMTRALSRSNIRISYSSGFNPRPRISFSNPIPLGVGSLAEYCDVMLEEDIDLQGFMGAVDAKLPSGLTIIEGARSKKKIPALMSEISHLLFEFGIRHKKMKTISEELANKAAVIIEEFNDMYGSIYDFDIKLDEGNIIFLKIFGYAKIFRNKNNKIFKYNEFTGFLQQFLNRESSEIESSCKKEAFFLKNDKLITPLEVL